MRVALRRGLAGALVALGCNAAHAQETRAPAPPQPVVDRAAYQLTYDHVTGGLEVRNEKGELITLSSGSPLRLPADRPLSVVVKNANSLLYTYDVSATVVAQKKVTACRSVVARFISTSLVSAVSMVGSGVQPGVLAGRFMKASASLQTDSAARGLGMHFTVAALNATLQRIRDSVNDYILFSAQVASLASTLSDSLVRVAELGDYTPIDPLLAGLQRAADHLRSGLHVPTQVAPVLLQRADSASGPLGELAQITRAIRAGDVDGGPATPAATEALALAAAADSAQRALRAASRQLQVVLRRIDTAHQHSQQTFTVGPSGDRRRVVIALTPTKDADMAGVPRVREGTVELYTEPTVPILCQLSVGIAWMDTPPLYAVENSSLVNRADNTRVVPALAFHVASPAFAFVGPLVGIGLGANHRPDFYAGGSLRLLQPVLVNAGVVWQYTPHLPAGTQLGQKISDPTFLHGLAFSYETHVFWGLSFAP